MSRVSECGRLIQQKQEYYIITYHFFFTEQNMPWIFNTRDCSKETNKQYSRAFDVPTKQAEPESKVAAVFFLGSYFVNLFILS